MSNSLDTNCLNCGNHTVGNYCNNCGQSTSINRITFKETIGDFFSSNFALEGPLLSTIKLMIIDPGKLFREFISGKRKTYYKPVAFFIVITAIYIIVRTAIDYDPLQGQVPNDNPEMPEIAKISIRAGRYMVTHINNIMFFLVFSIGICHRIFFRKQYNLSEYITVGFYISGIYTFLGMITMLTSVYIFYVPSTFNMVFLFGYLIYSSISFHQQDSLLAIIKYLLLGVFSIILYMFLGFGLSVFMVW